MEREILYLKVPNFPVAVERLRDPTLRGKPLAVCTAGPGANPLQAVSREAREEGLFRGMPRREAVRACPGLRLLPPDPAGYHRVSAALFQLLSGRAPLVEPVRPGSLFLDLSGTRRLLGPTRDQAWSIRKEIRDRLELAACLGMATSKLVSRVAVKAAPWEGLCDVFPGEERHFLEPLDVTVLPAAHPCSTAERLRELNIRKVKHLLPVPMAALRLAFGREALTLFRQVRGLDASPVRPPSLTPHIVEEETLPEESNEDGVLLFVLRGLAEQAGARLRSMRAETGRLEVEIQYADGVSSRRTARLHPPCRLDLPLFHTARTLLEQAAGRRVRLRRITLTCLDLRLGSVQEDLFPPEALYSAAALHSQALQGAVDGIRNRFGREALRWGRTPPCRPGR